MDWESEEDALRRGERENKRCSFCAAQFFRGGPHSREGGSRAKEDMDLIFRKKDGPLGNLGKIRRILTISSKFI